MIDGIPPGAEELFKRLYAVPLESEADLKARLEDYGTVLRDSVGQRGREINLVQAELLIDRSRRMLESVTVMTDEHDRRLIQAAVRYFLHAGDAQGDLRPGGLADDVEVVNAVARALLRSDLLIY